jgi:uncharacterized membrane protein YtjA (UPF0391 family)
MFRILAIFAVLTLVSGAFAFGWVGDEDGSELARILFWICAVILAGLTARALIRSPPEAP